MQKELQVCQTNLETVEKDFLNKKELFQTRFCGVIDNVNLERQAYHIGAIAGNGVNKLTKTANIKKIQCFQACNHSTEKWFTKGIFIS